MPYAYVIDPEHHLVETRRWGTVSTAEIAGLYDDLRLDPAFSPRLDQLADLTGMEEVSVDVGTIREMARLLIFEKGRKRAFVVAKDVHYGLVRMFAAHAQLEGQQVGVFRDLVNARKWLGIEEPDCPN
jgi:hypothetical protein